MVMILLAQVFFIVSLVKSSEILRLRGVAISKAVLYDASKDFTCFDGSFTIPFKFVNDDYCDCRDGSDEPGTSACPNGWYHCTNAGHQPLNIPSSRVNDGICDCCDGSDEYVTNNCSDYCSILGEEARIAAQKRAELIKSGCELREQLSWKGKKMRDEKKERLASLERDKTEAEAIKAEKEAIKQKAEQQESAVLEAYKMIEDVKKTEENELQKKQEEQEAFEAFTLIDSNNDEKIQIDELRARQTFDQNKDGVVSDSEVKFIMGELTELSWDDFLKTGWPRMKPFFMLEKGVFLPPATEQPPGADFDSDREKDELQTPPTEDDQEEEWDEGEGNGDDTDEDVESEHGDEAPMEDEADDKDEKSSPDENQPENGHENDDEEGKPKYDEESQKIIDEANKARSEYEAAERAVRDVEREMRQLQDVLSKDFGHEDEFAPLDGECFEYTDREYTYKLCPFDQVSQRPRSGGAETRLGSWKGWVGRNNLYSVMLYDHGQSCWNGPQRSAHVEVSCGLENAVTYAAEPNRCEYVLHFVTPSACWPEVQYENVPHDEL